MSYWDRDPVPRRAVEAQIETDLQRRLYEDPSVLSIRRQYRCYGNERADLVVLYGVDLVRWISVIEVKANAANIVHAQQLLRYVAWMKHRSDPGVPVSGVLAAPRFTRELVSWVEAAKTPLVQMLTVAAA